MAATWLVLLVQLSGGVLTRPGGTVGFRAAAVTPIEYARTRPAVILYYLRLVFWPEPLCFDFGWRPATAAAEIVPAALLVGVLVAAALVTTILPGGTAGLPSSALNTGGQATRATQPGCASAYFDYNRLWESPLTSLWISRGVGTDSGALLRLPQG